MPRMPMKLATVLIIVVSLLLPVALVSVWAARTVGDTDRYTAEMSAVAADPGVQEALATRLSAAIGDAIDGTRLDQSLTSLLEGRNTSPLIQQGVLALGDAARQRLVDRIHTAVDQFVQSEQFGVAWTKLNRAAHRQLVTVLEGGNTPLLATDGSLALDLAPLVAAVLERLDRQVLTWLLPVSAGAVSVTILSSADVQTAQQAYRLLTSLALWGPIVWVLLVAATLIFSRDRLRALTWLAIGSAVGALAILCGLWLAHRQVAAHIPNAQSAVLADSVVSHLSAGLGTVALGIVIVAIVVIIVVRISGSLGRPRATAPAGSAG